MSKSETLRAQLECAKAEASELRQRNRIMEGAIRDFHWMARRYADGRSSYVPSIFNDDVRACLRIGLEFTNGPLFARDGMGRDYDRLSEAEAAEAAIDSPASIRDEEMNELRATITALRSALGPFAKIVPSIVFPEDGSEAEKYDARLAAGAYHDFTGLDLAKARNAMGRAFDCLTEEEAEAAAVDAQDKPRDEEVADLCRKVKTLLAALQPFATYSGEDDRKQPGILYEKAASGQFCLPDGHGFHVCWSDPAGLAVNFTAGQFRRARNAWEQTK